MLLFPDGGRGIGGAGETMSNTQRARAWREIQEIYYKCTVHGDAFKSICKVPRETDDDIVFRPCQWGFRKNKNIKRYDVVRSLAMNHTHTHTKPNHTGVVVVRGV